MSVRTPKQRNKVLLAATEALLVASRQLHETGYRPCTSTHESLRNKVLDAAMEYAAAVRRHMRDR